MRNSNTPPGRRNSQRAGAEPRGLALWRRAGACVCPSCRKPLPADLRACRTRQNDWRDGVNPCCCCYFYCSSCSFSSCCRRSCAFPPCCCCCGRCCAAWARVLSVCGFAALCWWTAPALRRRRRRVHLHSGALAQRRSRLRAAAASAASRVGERPRLALMVSRAKEHKKNAIERSAAQSGTTEGCQREHFTKNALPPPLAG